MTACASPLLKWPGGKRFLVRKLATIFPAKINKYFEPFVGGGALFFALSPPRSHLSDTNSDLITLYEQVRDNPRGLLRVLRAYENSEETYYRIRAESPRTDLQRAARLLYLTTLSFNGIHRVNLNGHFNVPYGRKTHLKPHDQERVIRASNALAGASLAAKDFELATNTAGAGDLVYFDPPYTVAHAQNGFVKYNERIFSWDDQVRLANHAEHLASRGCHVIISNAAHDSVRKLYRNFDTIDVNRHSVIAADARHRKSITECIFYRLAY